MQENQTWNLEAGKVQCLSEQVMTGLFKIYAHIYYN